MRVSIIIPVFNEEKYIKEILTRVNNVKNIEKEIIVVNDFSTDSTKEILENDCKSLYSKLVNNDKNMGEGLFLQNRNKKILQGKLY